MAYCAVRGCREAKRQTLKMNLAELWRMTSDLYLLTIGQRPINPVNQTAGRVIVARTQTCYKQNIDLFVIVYLFQNSLFHPMKSNQN